MTAYKDITVEIEGHVQVVTIRRPPFNYFDNALIRELAAAFEAGDRNGQVRASVLAAEGKAFCAGADLVNRADTGTVAEGGQHLYKEAARLFRVEKPIIEALLDGRSPEPAVEDARMCAAGRIYLETLRELPEEIRMRIYALAVELMARS